MEKPVKASPTSNGSVTAAPALSPIQIGIETTFIKSSRFSRELAVDKTLTLEDKPVIRCEFRISHQALNQKDQYAITLSFGVTAEQESQTLPTKFDKHPHVPLLAKQVPPPHGKLAENGQMF